MNKDWYEMEEELFMAGGFIKMPKKVRQASIEDPWEESKRKVAEYKQRARNKQKSRLDSTYNQREQ